METHGTLTSGMTLADFSPSIIPNAAVATEIAADRFWDEVMRTYLAGRGAWLDRH